MKTRNLCAAVMAALVLTMSVLWALNSERTATAAPPCRTTQAPGDVITVCAATCDYASIQDAVDAAAGGEIIKVATGDYTDLHTRQGVTQVVYISKTVTIQGGYTTANWTTPDPDANPTTLDAGGQGRVLHITGDISSTIEGLRITGGDATGLGGDPWGNDSGGGVYVVTATTTFSGNRVFDNSAYYGGGLFLQNADGSALSGNTIFTNTASGSPWPEGGGLYIYGTTATVSGNTITDNAAGENGGGLYAWTSTVTLVNNDIVSNTAYSGAGLQLYECDDAVLEGNTIALNSAKGLSADGGGLYISFGRNTTLQSNFILTNTAGYEGGGAYVENANLTLRDNQIVSNTGGGSGGGLALLGSPVITLEYNTVALNISGDEGGGLYGSAGNATILENTFSRNRADYGGGLRFSGDGRLAGNTVVFNTAITDGGGLYMEASDATLAGTIILSNTALSGSGGGIYLNSLSDPVFTNTVVADNWANTTGSGFYVEDSFPTLLHSTIAQNTGGDGSGLHVTNDGWSSRVEMTNTILVSHTVGVTVTAGNDAELEATLWGNDTDWGGAGNVVTGTINIWGDPAFVDPDLSDYHIGLTSDALEEGVDAGARDDADGDPRPLGGGYDIGADETGLSVGKQTHPYLAPAGGVLTYTVRITNFSDVDLHATVTDTLPQHVIPTGQIVTPALITAPGGIWTGQFTVAVEPTCTEVLTNFVEVTTDEGATGTATITNPCRTCFARLNDDPTDYLTVQAAVDASDDPGDVVKVAGYCADIHSRSGVTQVVYLSKTLTLQGGYNLYDWDFPDPLANPTTLDAMGQGRVIYVTGDVSPTIELLEITGGNAEGLGGDYVYGGDYDAGGGIYVISASATIRDNWIYSNTAPAVNGEGGGIFAITSSVTISNNQIYTNAAENGAGVYILDSEGVTLTSNDLLGNDATWGGGMAVDQSDATLDANTLLHNIATMGGGIYLWPGRTVTLSDNDVISNTATTEGGGLYVHGSLSARLSANTIVSNTASQHGGGLCVHGADISLENDDVSANRAGMAGGGLYAEDGSHATLNGAAVVHNTVYGGSMIALGGGGLYVYTSTAVLTNTTIATNTTTGSSGGGIYLGDRGGSALSGNEIFSNIAALNGGGLYLQGSDATLINTVIYENTANNGGGVYLAAASNATLTNTVVIDNDANLLGGGLFVSTASPRLVHTTIARNSGASGVQVEGFAGGPKKMALNSPSAPDVVQIQNGGPSPVSNSSVTLTNTILVSHTVGISVTSGNTLTLNSVLWHNTPVTVSHPVTVSISVQNEYWGNPLFDTDGYHLTGSSEAIDRGVDTGVEADIDGESRPAGDNPDLGADEFGLTSVYLPLVMRNH